MDAKSVNSSPEFQPEKVIVGKKCGDDVLSEMPDDTLIDILSLLPLREAARTSLLSTRWTNLWRHSLRLHFDDASYKFVKHPNSLNEDRCNYINWVNSVLRSHKAPTLDEFRIRFDLDNSSSEAITTWLQFAFARRVQRLELSLLELEYGGGDDDKSNSNSNKYNFPAELLVPSLFKPLKALCFRGVNVSGEDIEFFLRNCPLLEQLVVQESSKMTNVEVCGSSLALKHLEIFDCYPRGFAIKISAPNLTCLKVKTLSRLLLENVPMLVEFNLVCGYNDIYVFNKLADVLHCCIPQLEILTVDLSCYMKLEVLELPEMPKLKKLKIEYSAMYDESIMALTCFLKASPQLEEFEVKMMDTILWWSRRGGDAIMDFPHEHLKVFKLSGYCGRSGTEMELVRNVWENCVGLQKIIIDPRFLPSQLPPRPGGDCVLEQEARNYLRSLLEPQVPHHIQLLII